MSIKTLSQWGSCTVLATILLAHPFASQASPLGNNDGIGAINALHLSGVQLTTDQLGKIRGGFDVSPKLSINFGFQQIDTLGDKILQSVLVPTTTLTAASSSPQVIVSGGADTTLSVSTANTQAGPPSSTAGNGNNASNGADNRAGGQGAAPSSTAAGGLFNSGETTVVPANTGNITVTSKANNGQTTVLSQLGNSGIANVISNTANNTLLSQVTTISIDITGMSQWLSRQNGGLMSAGAFGSSAFSR